MLGCFFFYSSVLLDIFVEINTAQTTDYKFNSLCLIVRDTHTVMHIPMYLFAFSSPKKIYFKKLSDSGDNATTSHLISPKP